MKRFLTILLLLSAASLLIYVRLQPLRALNSTRPFTGDAGVHPRSLVYSKEKKTVVIMADTERTEMFDLLAPFYLFSETGKANVYIAAQKRSPVTMKNGPFLIPHVSYSDLDSLNIHPDVIVIPYMNAPESPQKTSWIRKHYSDSVVLLSICDGAWTAAASGLYDAKPLTSHATGHQRLKKRFSRPHWVQNVSVTSSGNLFSTGGVSNAVEGSLAVIQRLFGAETMLQVMKNVHYPHPVLQTSHTSTALNTTGVAAALYRMLFRRHKNLGMVLQNGISEFDLAAIYDTYNRSLPACVQTIIPGGGSIQTKYGLEIFTSDEIEPATIDELHLFSKGQAKATIVESYLTSKVVVHDTAKSDYIFDGCLEKIRNDYGRSFRDYVKLTLDYN